MRYKTLMALAVAGAVGWSVNTLAGSGYEVSTPMSVNETGLVLALDTASHSRWMSGSETPIITSSSESYAGDDSAVGAIADSGSGSISGSVAGDEYASASLSDEDVLARADEGIYSDFYRVSFTPIALSGWDYYVLVDDDEGLASYALLMPVEDTITLAWNDAFDAGAGDGAVTTVFEDGSILQVFDDGSMLAFAEDLDTVFVG